MTTKIADAVSRSDGNAKERQRRRKRIAFFGHFASTNFGNESTLRAVLYNLQRFQPDAEAVCISTSPQATIAAHHIEAIPIAESFSPCNYRNPLIRAARKVCIGIPREFYRWVKALLTLRRIDLLIIPGTGLLTDAYGLSNWGPYSLFKWSLLAKICRCKLLFVSVGAGPIYGTLGRCFVKSVLTFADFRSYRDNASLQYLKGIGFSARDDRVYPDLVFSFPERLIPHPQTRRNNRRPVVGLGVMHYAGKYSVPRPVDATYLDYLENLVKVVKWLLAHEYEVRLLIGDLEDVRATAELRSLLRGQLSECDEEHIIDEPISSVEDLFSQMAATDIVVATRFHNVLIASLCNKPVLSISFHNKCQSLMSALGLSEYCLDINDMKAERVIEKFCDLEINSDRLKPLIREKVIQFRNALDEQYKFVFADM